MTVSPVPVPVPFGQEFEGERIRDDGVFLEAGRDTLMVEWVTTAPTEEVTDGRIIVTGADIGDSTPPAQVPLAIMVQVSGRLMQPDYEPILERRIHQLLNYGKGIMHTGQRDAATLRISRAAAASGLTLEHLGTILHAGLHHEFERIIEKIQVTITTDAQQAAAIRQEAATAYRQRDARIEGMTDEDTGTFYSCTICQSHAPGHVCIVTPEHTGSCGAYTWLDCKAAYDVNPIGPSRPVPKGKPVDGARGQWQGVNDFLLEASGGRTSRCNLYSLVHHPITTCECAEAIAAVLPLCNGIMTVSRAWLRETPSGMTFNRLMELTGGGLSTPGFAGHSIFHITQQKFFSADGGLLRLVWMPRAVKQAVAGRFSRRVAELGIPDLLERIADETVGVTEETILPFLRKKHHPVLSMPPLLQ